MTKTQYSQVLTDLLIDKLDDDTFEAVMNGLKQLGTKAAKEGRAVEIEVDGEAYKWCTKHKVYEPKEWFPAVGTKGELNPACALAVSKWRALGKQISEATKAGEYETLGKLTVERKSAKYDFASDLEEFGDDLEIPQDIDLLHESE